MCDLAETWQRSPLSSRIVVKIGSCAYFSRCQTAFLNPIHVEIGDRNTTGHVKVARYR